MYIFTYSVPYIFIYLSIYFTYLFHLFYFTYFLPCKPMNTLLYSPGEDNKVFIGNGITNPIHKWLPISNPFFFVLKLAQLASFERKFSFELST